MKVSKFKLAFIVLLIATIIWGSAFYHTLQEYRKHREWLESEECPIIERLKYLWDGLEPYWLWNGGKYVCSAGIFLFVAWIGFIVTVLEKLSERKKPAANLLEARSRLAQGEGQKENENIKMG